MAQRNALPGNISIEQIRVDVNNCPGCAREHTVAVRRPSTSHRCGRSDGDFTVNVSSSSGQYIVTVYFNGVVDGKHISKEITKDCKIYTV